MLHILLYTLVNKKQRKEIMLDERDVIHASVMCHKEKNNSIKH